MKVTSIRIENRATRDQQNMVRLCKSIIYNLAELIKETEEKNKTITEKKSPLESTPKKVVLLTTQEETCRPGFE